MLHGDISNRKAPSILFRVDGFLVKYKDHTLKDKLLNTIMGKQKRSEIDPRVASTMKRTFRATDFAIGVAVLESEWDRYSSSLKEELIHLPIGDIHIINDHHDISLMLDTWEYYFYVDDNEDNISLVNNMRGISLKHYEANVLGGAK